MPNFFYLDANGQKRGPVNDQQLKTLAERGVITPATPLMTDTGHKGKAGQIQGLFNESPPNPFTASAPATNQAIPPSAAPTVAGSKIPLWAIGVSVLCLVLVGVMAGIMMTSSPSTPAQQVANGSGNVAGNTAVAEAPVNVSPPNQGTAQPAPVAPQMQFTAAEQLEIDRFLGEYGDDIRAVHSSGVESGITMLHRAVQYSTPTVVKYLVSEGLSVHARTSHRESTLHRAVRNDNTAASVEIINFLISQGADVNAGDNRNVTPLHGAVSRQNVEAVRVLISQGANVNARGLRNSTPLHSAVLSFRENDDAPEIVRLLVSNGADINARAERPMTGTNPQVTPLDYARDNVQSARNANERARAEAVLAALQGR